MTGPNLNFIDELAAGDSTFKNKIISIIKTELPIEISAYRSSIETLDYDTAAAHVHKLKHKISILAMTDSYETVVTYEENLRNGNKKGEDRFDKILAAISKFIDDL